MAVDLWVLQWHLSYQRESYVTFFPLQEAALFATVLLGKASVYTECSISPLYTPRRPKVSRLDFMKRYRMQSKELERLFDALLLEQLLTWEAQAEYRSVPGLPPWLLNGFEFFL